MERATDLNLKTLRALAIGLVAAGASLCQIAQDHPELCGSPTEPVPVPPNVTAITNPGNGVSTLVVEMNGISAD